MFVAYLGDDKDADKFHLSIIRIPPAANRPLKQINSSTLGIEQNELPSAPHKQKLIINPFNRSSRKIQMVVGSLLSKFLNPHGRFLTGIRTNGISHACFVRRRSDVGQHEAIIA